MFKTKIIATCYTHTPRCAGTLYIAFGPDLPFVEARCGKCNHTYVLGIAVAAAMDMPIANFDNDTSVATIALKTKGQK